MNLESAVDLYPFSCGQFSYSAYVCQRTVRIMRIKHDVDHKDRGDSMYYLVETSKSFQQASTDLEAAVMRHGFNRYFH